MCVCVAGEGVRVCVAGEGESACDSTAHCLQAPPTDLRSLTTSFVFPK